MTTAINTASLTVDSADRKPWPIDAWGDLGGDVEYFVIGDVHGSAAQLLLMLQEIGATPRTTARRVLVQTGDMLDRGLANLECLALFRRMGEIARADETVALPGNHCLMTHSALRHPNGACAESALRLWAYNGGLGVIEELEAATGIKIHDRKSLARAVAAHEDFTFWLDAIDQSPSHLRAGNLLFVHAGVAPKAPVEDFLDLHRDAHITHRGGVEWHWAWIREPFLACQRSFRDRAGTEVIVIHGHTPVSDKNVGTTPSKRVARLLDAMDRAATNRRLNVDAGIFIRGALGGAHLTRDGYRLMVVHGMD